MEPNSFALMFLRAFPIFLSLHFVEKLQSDKEELEAEQANKASEQMIYDFIIVGAGTAGCVIANRLSEKYTVLLLEAGGPVPTGASADVPALFEMVAMAPELNYFFTSVPQKHGENRAFIKSMGKMLGGTNSHNSMLHNRGHSLDYDSWATLTKDESWKYQNLLEFFKKSEKYIGKHPSDQHGTDGPLTIETNLLPILSTWLKAGEELGYKSGDPNGPQFEGFFSSDITRRRGRRESTFTAFIHPLQNTRKNLKIIKFANVFNVLFNSTGNEHKAIGVNFSRHGFQFSAFAKKEVILSAGAFGSPLLLFKSGIGPFEMLKEAEISPLISNLPVGLNMQDHPGVPLGPFAINDPSLLFSIDNNLTEAHVKEYSEFKDDGVLSVSGLGPQAYFVSSIAKKRGENSWPDIQMFHIGTHFGNTGRNGSEAVTNVFSVAILVGRPDPKHVGTFKLNTEAFKKGIKDNTELALIDYNFMGSAMDLAVQLEGIQLAMKIFESKTFGALGARLIPHEKCAEEHKFNTDPYWDCYIRRTGTTWIHSAGTCRMGSGADDVKAVTDSKLRVLGVKNLRIADASVIPQITNANPNAVVIVIAEKAAAEILKQYSA